MAKKREFASDSDISKFITKKQNHSDDEEYITKRLSVTLYPDKKTLEQVKILSQMKGQSLTSMFLELVKNSLQTDEYQKIINAYKQITNLI